MERDGAMGAHGSGRVLQPRRGDHSAVCGGVGGLAVCEHPADIHRHQIPVYEEVSNTSAQCLSISASPRR